MTRDSSAVAVTASIGRPVEPARRLSPGPEPIEHSRGHQEAQRKAVGEPLNSFPAPLGAIRDVLRRYRVPGEDMEKGVRKVEMPPRRDHQNERAEVTLHDPRKTRSRSIPQSELTRKPLACSSRVLGAVPQRHPEAAPEQGSGEPTWVAPGWRLLDIMMPRLLASKHANDPDPGR